MIPCIYLSAFWRRFSVARGLQVLLLCLLLTACTATEKPAPSPGSDTGSGNGSGTASTAESDTDSALTDITELLLTTSNSEGSSTSGVTLLNVAAADDGRIFALYREDTPDARELRVESVDATRSERQRTEHFRVSCDGERLTQSAFSANTWAIVSTDPLVIYNEADGVLCLPSEESSAPKSASEVASEASVVNLSQRMRGASLRSLHGKIWLSITDGFVYELSATGELQLAWTLPAEYSFLTPASGTGENVLTFKTYGISNPELAINLDLDPEKGTFETYTKEDDDVYYSASRHGRLVSTYSERGTTVTLWNAQTTSVYSLDFPAEIQTTMTNRYLSPAVPDLFSAGNQCLLYLASEEGLPASIYLWRFTNSASKDAWTPPVHTPLQVKEAADYGELTARANELGQKYGLQIILGENLPETFANYRAETCTISPVISSALDRLEETLALYPENFFRSLEEGYYRGICIYLTGGLTPLDTSQNISNAGAFTTVDNGLARIAINLGEPVTTGLLVHELTHVLDHRAVQEGWVDENAWNDLNPPEFAYYNAYINEHGESYEQVGSPSNTVGGEVDLEEVYFCDIYSKTFPTEDRARLFERLLSNAKEVDPALRGTHLREKLIYYFQVIRTHLGDDTWPAATTWEAAIEVK